MEIRMKTSIVVRMLQMMSARLKEGKALFDPIKISIIPRKDDKYAVIAMMTNKNGTAYAVTRFSDIQASGIEEDGSVLCVYADTLISYFEECYGSDETIKMWDDGIWLKAINEDAEYPTEVRHPQVSEDNETLRSLEEFPFTMKEGIPYYSNGTIKPDTEVAIDVSEIHKAIKHKSRVTKHAMGGTSPKYYKFIFGTEKSFVIIGDMEDPTMSPIKKQLNCVVDGPDATFTVGDEDLEHVAGILSGAIQIYCKTDCPVWITQKGDDYGIGYLVAPKADEEEVNVEVTEEGDVEIVNVEDDDTESEDLDISESEDAEVVVIDDLDEVTVEETIEVSETDVVVEDVTGSSEDITTTPEEDQEETGGEDDDLTDLDLGNDIE